MLVTYIFILLGVATLLMLVPFVLYVFGRISAGLLEVFCITSAQILGICFVLLFVNHLAANGAF